MFKRNDILILIGAGASVDAGIPHSIKMIEEVESLIKEDWLSFRDIYHYIHSAILYADGIKGKIINYNIERLVETLDELAKRDDHPLYPFVGAWNPKLIEVAGIGFEKIQKFKDKIVEKLRYKWVEIERSEDAIYYDGLIKFRSEYAHPLRIFTLNYDLCVEKACQRVLGEHPQRGFEDRKWDWRLFDDIPDNNTPIFLYKLHGSTDWKIETDNTLTYKDSISSIDSRDVAIIFGTTYKLQYVDPFLFLVYEFRRWTLEAKLILTIGYGFGDEHINGIISQALRVNPERKLLSISPTNSDDEVKIRKLLKINDSKNQIFHWNHGAKDFFNNKLNLESLSSLFPETEQLFDEISRN